MKLLKLTLLLIILNNSSYATTRYVTSAGSGSLDGSSWTNAAPGESLQIMINASVASDQVWVACGTYLTTNSTNRSVSFSMKNGVEIYGGFNGTETTLSQRVFSCSPCSILSGEIGAVGNADNSYKVISNQLLENTSILDGFIIRDANDNRSPTNLGNGLGGGIYNHGYGATGYCHPTIRNCVIYNNYASWGAGAFNNGYNSGNTEPVYTNCVFYENHAYIEAGGMDSYGVGGNASPTITNTIFYGNTSETNAGAMYIWGGNVGGQSNPILTNCVFANNSATNGYGGGFVVSNLDENGTTSSGSSTITLKNCIMWNNTATGVAPQFYVRGSGAQVIATYSDIDLIGQTAPHILSGTLEGNLNTDPLFLNISNGAGADGCWLTLDDGLQLQGSSLLINAGNSTGAPLEDILQVPHFGNPDIGAYEFSAMTPISTVTWSGSWDNGTGPSASDAVIIQANYSFSSDGSFECNDLTVASDAVVTVDGNNTLIVNGDLDVSSGSITVESGASLLTYDANTITGDAFIIKRNTRYADGKYSFVGTPVAQNSSMTSADLGSLVYRYNETIGFANAGLNRWENANGDQLIPGKGYAQAFQKELTFEGVPNDGTITYTGTFTDLPNSNPEGWNFVANPYPAAINVTKFLNENANTTGSVYIWDDNNSASVRGSNDDYIIANGITYTQNSQAESGDRYNAHLGSAQGFFVKLNDNSDLDITFTETMRVSGLNSDDNFFRQAEEQVPYARVNLTSTNGLFKQMVIGWVSGISEDQINRLYDAELFSEEADYLLYSSKLGKKLAILGISENKVTVPLGMNIASAGAYALEVDFDAANGKQLFLFDKLTSEVTDLTSKAYTFTSEAGQISDRFEVYTSMNVLEAETIKSKIYSVGKMLYINAPNQAPIQYRIFNLSGRHMMSTTIAGSEAIDLSRLARGVYLISNGAHTEKIILK